MSKNMATVGEENVVNDGAVVQAGGNQENAAQVFCSVNISRVLTSFIFITSLLSYHN